MYGSNTERKGVIIDNINWRSTLVSLFHRRLHDFQRSVAVPQGRLVLVEKLL